MSHLPDYFEHLVRDRGLSRADAADKLAVVQNAFGSSAARRAFFAKLGAGQIKGGGAQSRRTVGKMKSRRVDTIGTVASRIPTSPTTKSPFEGKMTPFRKRLDVQLGSGHTVKLPKDKKALTIPKAQEALEQMGHKLGKPTTDLKTKKTGYEVAWADGTRSVESVDSIKDLVYKASKDL